MPQLRGKEVGPIGFGMMGFSWRADPIPQEQALETMRAAFEQGMTLWNGGEFYGTPEYNSVVLLERYFERYPEDVEKVVICIKGGVSLKTFLPDGSPEATRKSLDHILAMLKGRKTLDVFEFARRDQDVPMRTTFETIENEYVKTGKLGGISLSEVRAETIHEAVKITKVVCVEVELSLFSREVLENGVAAACAQYGIPLIAYSPIGRGLLSGKIRTEAEVPQHYRWLPMFQGRNLEDNLVLVRQVEAMARRKGVTAAQLAIGWTRALSRRPGMPTIIPIPGATTAARVRENAVPVDISDAEMAEIDDTLKGFRRAGDRYPADIPINT
ncbi:putative aldo/keto reductase [Xylariaceae sp. FL0662B]|nr:putative aldo/keto reductase [Xylariaceae sp. FL0662B]